MIELALAVTQLASEPVDCRQQPDAHEAEAFEHSGDPDYFPYGEVDALECDWYSKHLASLEEVPLALGGAAYRLRYLILPTFAAPLSITVTGFEDGTGRMEVRASDGLGGYDAGKLVMYEIGTLSVAATARISDEISDANLCGAHPMDEVGYKAPSADPNSEESVLVVTADGTRRVFEWVTEGGYCLRDALARRNDQMSKLDFWLFEILDQLDQAGAMSAVKRVDASRWRQRKPTERTRRRTEKAGF